MRWGGRRVEPRNGKAPTSRSIPKSTGDSRRYTGARYTGGGIVRWGGSAFAESSSYAKASADKVADETTDAWRTGVE